MLPEPSPPARPTSAAALRPQPRSRLRPRMHPELDEHPLGVVPRGVRADPEPVRDVRLEQPSVRSRPPRSREASSRARRADGPPRAPARPAGRSRLGARPARPRPPRPRRRARCDRISNTDARRRAISSRASARSSWWLDRSSESWSGVIGFFTAPPAADSDTFGHHGRHQSDPPAPDAGPERAHAGVGRAGSERRAYRGGLSPARPPGRGSRRSPGTRSARPSRGRGRSPFSTGCSDRSSSATRGRRPSWSGRSRPPCASALTAS